jgi:hypothetical protein
LKYKVKGSSLRVLRLGFFDKTLGVFDEEEEEKWTSFLKELA